VVAESQPGAARQGVSIVKRVAARLYITVPGKAKPAIRIDSVQTERDNPLLPRHATVTMVIRNTGNVRLRPSVTVNGRVVRGPAVIVSQSAEQFRTTIPLPIMGGRRTVDVRVATRTEQGAGPTARATRRVTVFPWWMLLALFLLAVGAVAVRELRRRMQ
jgi:hypothetical protein